MSDSDNESYGTRPAAIAASPAEAERLISRAEKEFKGQRLLRSFETWGEAIALLEQKWVKTHDFAVGERLVQAYTWGAYPALRKAFVAKQPQTKNLWHGYGDERMRKAIALFHHISLAGGLTQPREALELVMLMHNRAINKLNENGDYDAAYRQVLDAYLFWHIALPKEQFEPNMLLALRCIEATCLAQWHVVDKAREVIEHTLLQLDDWLSENTQRRQSIWFTRLLALRERLSQLGSGTLH